MRARDATHEGLYCALLLVEDSRDNEQTPQSPSSTQICRYEVSSATSMPSSRAARTKNFLIRKFFQRAEWQKIIVIFPLRYWELNAPWNDKLLQ